MARVSKWVPLCGFIFSIGGFCDSLYLTIAHYLSTVTLACSDSGWINCDKVTTSNYSIVFGIPLPLIGLLFFGVMFFLQLPMAWRAPQKWLYWLRILMTTGAVLGVFYLVYVELFQLDAICLYCTYIHILIIALFIVTVLGSAQAMTPEAT